MTTLPDLTGTDKQIAYATSVRAVTLAILDDIAGWNDPNGDCILATKLAAAVRASDCLLVEP